MKCLEIISVRTLVSLRQEVHEVLHSIYSEIEESTRAEVEVYESCDIPSDLAIIITWEGTSLKRGKSGQGDTLSSVLKHYGLVDHVVWMMTGRSTENRQEGNKRDKIDLRYLIPQVSDTVHIPVTAADKKKVSHNNQSLEKA